MMWLLWVIVGAAFKVNAAMEPSHEMMRFRATSRAQTLEAFESTRRQYELYDAAMLACRRELRVNRVPVNCYVVLKMDNNNEDGLRDQTGLSLRELAQVCEKNAKVARDLPHKTHVKLLPTDCARTLSLREKILDYKLGRDLE